MSQCDCTWKQEVKGLAAWKVEFEENLCEGLPCYLLFSQQSHDSTNAAAAQENPYHPFCISPIYNSSLLPLYFLVNSSLSHTHTQVSTPIPKGSCWQHMLCSAFQLSRQNSLINLFLLQSAHNTCSNETFMVPYSKIDWDPIQSTTTLDGSKMPKGQPSYLELGLIQS